MRDSHEANITTITSLHQLPILAEVTMDTPREVIIAGKSLQDSQTFTQTNHQLQGSFYLTERYNLIGCCKRAEKV